MSEKENTKSSSSEGSTAAPTQAAAAKAAATKLNIAAKEFVPGKGFGTVGGGSAPATATASQSGNGSAGQGGGGGAGGGGQSNRNPRGGRHHNNHNNHHGNNNGAYGGGRQQQQQQHHGQGMQGGYNPNIGIYPGGFVGMPPGVPYFNHQGGMPPGDMNQQQQLMFYQQQQQQQYLIMQQQQYQQSMGNNMMPPSAAFAPLPYMMSPGPYMGAYPGSTADGTTDAKASAEASDDVADVAEGASDQPEERKADADAAPAAAAESTVEDRASEKSKKETEGSRSSDQEPLMLDVSENPPAAGDLNASAAPTADSVVGSAPSTLASSGPAAASPTPPAPTTLATTAVSASAGPPGLAARPAVDAGNWRSKSSQPAPSVPAAPPAPAAAQAEAATANTRMYSKATLLELLGDIRATTRIPAELRIYYTSENFDAGQQNGERFARVPIGTDSRAIIEKGSVSSPNRGGGGGGGGSGGGNNFRGDRNDRGDRGDRRGGNDRGNHNYTRSRDRQEDEQYADFYALDPRDGTAISSPPPGYVSMFNKIDDSNPDSVRRKAIFTLNKMSVTNFNKLSDEFVDLLKETCSTSEAMLRKGVEALIFKAQLEEHFCFLYADLCRKIIDTWQDLEPDATSFSTVQEIVEAAANDKVDASSPAPPSPDADAGAEASSLTAKTTDDSAPAPTPVPARELRTMGKVFKEFLLLGCQAEFEFDRVSALEAILSDSSLAPDERLEKEIALKKRFIGQMRFIGEIYMCDLVKANIIKDHCLDVLMKSSEEEELVCLVKLFQTIGKKIEQYFMDKSRQKKNRDKGYESVISEYFDRIKEMAVSHPVSRIRFMLQGLVEERDKGWVARIQKERMVNAADLEASRQTSSVSFNGDSGVGGSMSRQNSPAPYDMGGEADEWNVVGGSSRGTRKGGAGGSASSGNLAGMSRGSSSNNLARNNSSNIGASGPGSLGGQDRRSGRFQQQGGGGGGGNRDRDRDDGRRRQGSGAPEKQNSSRGGGGFGPGSSGRGPNAAGRATPPAPSPSMRGGSYTRTSASPVTRPATAPLPELSGRGEQRSRDKGIAAPASGGGTQHPVTSDAAAVQKRLLSTAEELYFNGDSSSGLEEACLTVEELNPAKSLMPAAVKSLIMASLERPKDKDRALLCDLLHTLSQRTNPSSASSGGQQGEMLLTPADVSEAVLQVLDELDDVIIDVPKAGVYGARVFAGLVKSGLLQLSLFGNIPSDNMFSTSSRLAEMVVQVLAQLKSLFGDDAAAEGQVQQQLQTSGVQLRSLVSAAPRETPEEVLKALGTKHRLTFLA